MEKYELCYDDVKTHKNFLPFLDTLYICELKLKEMLYSLRNSTGTAVVYTFYDRDLNLLYVGKSNNFRQRWSMHRKAKDLQNVRMVVVYTYESMADAAFNESQAIVRKQPAWNSVGKNESYSQYKIPPLDKYVFIYTAQNTGYEGQKKDSNSVKSLEDNH